MIEDFFDHTCDIYHLVKTTEDAGYGLGGKTEYGYGETPDIEGIRCHFAVKNQTLVTIQNEPQQDLEARIKLTLPAGTDIRVNDRIVSGVTGYSYKAEIPRDIRGHHMTVYVKREDTERAL